MSFQATVFQIMLSSPKDCIGFRKKIEEAINGTTRELIEEKKIVYNYLSWDQNLELNSSKKIQEDINEDLIRRADLAIVIFHSRIGGDNQKASSTVEEIEIFKLRKINYLILHCDYDLNDKILYNIDDLEQLLKLRKYLKEIGEEGNRIESVKDDEQLKDTITKFLKRQKITSQVEDVGKVLKETKSIDNKKNITKANADKVKISGIKKAITKTYSLDEIYSEKIVEVNAFILKKLLEEKMDNFNFQEGFNISNLRGLYKDVFGEFELKRYGFNKFIDFLKYSLHNTGFSLFESSDPRLNTSQLIAKKGVEIKNYVPVETQPLPVFNSERGYYHFLSCTPVLVLSPQGVLDQQLKVLKKNQKKSIRRKDLIAELQNIGGYSLLLNTLFRMNIVEIIQEYASETDEDIFKFGKIDSVEIKENIINQISENLSQKIYNFNPNIEIIRNIV